MRVSAYMRVGMVSIEDNIDSHHCTRVILPGYGMPVIFVLSVMPMWVSFESRMMLCIVRQRCVCSVVHVSIFSCQFEISLPARVQRISSHILTGYLNSANFSFASDRQITVIHPSTRISELLLYTY